MAIETNPIIVIKGLTTRIDMKSIEAMIREFISNKIELIATIV